jgi:hypothetical protein
MRDESIAAGAQKVVYGGGSAAFIGGLTANEIAAFGGLLVAIVGVIVQIYYNRKRDRREQELHAARLDRLEDDSPTDYGDGGL